MKKMLIVAMAVTCALYAYEYTRPVDKIEVKATVKVGSTLWDLVGDAMQEVGDCRDIREVVYYTKKLNGIKEVGKLCAGQKIIIPCEVKR